MCTLQFYLPPQSKMWNRCQNEARYFNGKCVQVSILLLELDRGRFLENDWRVRVNIMYTRRQAVYYNVALRCAGAVIVAVEKQ